jgi:folate-binding protein YgfZ
MTGYEALRQAAAMIDVSTRGRIRVTGEDRKRLLHAMTTNHVQEMEAGQTRYAFFLNAQGRILSDVWILCLEDALILDVEPEVREKIFQHLDRYIIADDVTLEDITETTSEYSVEGPAAARPEGIVIEGGLTGQPGFRVIVPRGETVSTAAVPCSLEEARVVRVENAVPRYGEEMLETNLAQETGRDQALHFNKGCYLGQEIVERVRSRGQVTKGLKALAIAGTSVPAAGAKVMSGDKEAGELRSAVWSPGEGRVRALALLRLSQLTAPLTVDGAVVELVQHR